MNWEFQLRFYTEVPGTEPAHPDAGRPRAACREARLEEGSEDTATA